MNRHILWFALCLVCFAQSLTAQHSYPISVYDPETYNDFRQNWSAIQDRDGRLFFGNSNGLLSFDGARWHQALHAPVGSAVLSLYQKNDTIYWGGAGDMGIIVPDSSGMYSLEKKREKK